VADAPGDMNPDNNEYTTWVQVKHDAPEIYPYLYNLDYNALINQPKNIPVRFKNNGIREANNVTASLYEVTSRVWNGTDYIENLTLIQTISVATIEPGEYKPVNFTITPNETGRLNLKVIAEVPGDPVPDNNLIDFFVDVMHYAPDIQLYIYNLDYRALVDQPKNITVRFGNSGFREANNVTASLYEVTSRVWNGTDYIDNLTLIQTISVGTIIPGPEVYKNFTWTPTESGQKHLRVVADAPGDPNPDDNEYDFYIEVIHDAPDIQCYPYYFDYKALVNQQKNITIRFRNLGVRTAENVVASLYELIDSVWNGTDYIDNLTLIQTISVGTIEPGEYKLVNFTITPNEVRYINLKIVTEAPGDMNPHNNEYHFYLNVMHDAPDTHVYVPYGDRTANLNEEKKITAKFGNSGFRDATNVTASLYEVTNSFWNGTEYTENLTLIQTISVGTIEPEEYKYADFTWTPTEPGYIDLKIFINAPWDQNPENNVYHFFMLVNLNVPDVTGSVYVDSVIGVDETFQIYAYVRENNYIHSQNVSAKLYDILPDNSKVLLWKKYLGSQLPSQEYVNWTPDVLGDHIIQLEITADTDYDPTNNIINRTVTVAETINATFIIPDISGFETYITHRRNGYTSKYIEVNGSITLNLIDSDTSIAVHYIRNLENYYNQTHYAITFTGSELNPVMRVSSDIIYGYRETEGLETHVIYSIVPDWQYNTTMISVLDNSTNMGIPVKENLDVYGCDSWDSLNKECQSGWYLVQTSKHIVGGRMSFLASTDKPEALALAEPRKSQIVNRGRDISGYLLMKVQEDFGTGWVDVKIVVNDLEKNNMRTIPSGGVLALDTIWNESGAYIPNMYGFFRIYAVLLDSNENVIVTDNGDKLETTYQFKVYY
jgi:hypothetical protein